MLPLITFLLIILGNRPKLLISVGNYSYSKTSLLIQLVTCFYHSYSIGAPVVSHYLLMM